MRIYEFCNVDLDEKGKSVDAFYFFKVEFIGRFIAFNGLLGFGYFFTIYDFLV
jgi:hypothetical protein